jgi:hypothetical protein
LYKNGNQFVVNVNLIVNTKSRSPERASEILIAEAVYNGIHYSIHDDQVMRDEPQSAVGGVNLQVKVRKSVSLHRAYIADSSLSAVGEQLTFNGTVIQQFYI